MYIKPPPCPNKVFSWKFACAVQLGLQDILQVHVADIRFGPKIF